MLLFALLIPERALVSPEQTRIFERFYRGSTEPFDDDDAVGLGLAIVKHVALTHHGTVTLWSAPGQGSTFNFFIPLA